MVRNEAHRPLSLYVVHADDVGEPVENVRVVATLLLMPGESCDEDGFKAYLDIAGCAFRAALVAKNGALVMSDPRHFAP